MFNNNLVGLNTKFFLVRYKMGNAFATLAPSPKEADQQSGPITQPNNLPTVPESEVVKNLNVMTQLLEKFKENDIKELQNVINENRIFEQADLNDQSFVKIQTIISEYYKEFEKNLEPGVDLKTKTQFGKFYEFLKEIETKDLKESREAVTNSELLKQNPNELESVNKIFDNIGIMKAKEKYFKYEYILTQLWLMAFLKKLNVTLMEFTEKTIELVEKNEKKRNEWAHLMLDKLLAIMASMSSDLNEQDFEFFRQGLDKFKGKMEQDTEKVRTTIEGFAKDINQTLAATATPGAGPGAGQAQGPGLRGGFVRDGSRFPQAFYELSRE